MPEPIEDETPTLFDQLAGKLQLAERDTVALAHVLEAYAVEQRTSDAPPADTPDALANEILEQLDRHGWVLVRAEELGTTLPEEEPTDEQRSEGLMRASQLADRDHGAPVTEEVLDAAERFARFLQNGHRVGLPALDLPADEAAQERLGEQLAGELAERVSQATGGNLSGLDAALVVLKAAQPALRYEVEQAADRRAQAEPF